MAPRAKKQQPSGSENANAAPPMNARSATPSNTTPERSQPRRSVAITEAQKQALMDNLQLEITERARKLRAQYALLAQGLRSRLEMRVNRIPHSLRKTNIMDLVEKYSEQPPAAPTATNTITPIPVPTFVPKTSQTSVQQKLVAAKSTSPEQTRGRKRPSDEVADKENVQQDLAVPKKRTKTTNKPATATAQSKAIRQVSRTDVPSSVLSPKSNNSRTFPRSPFKDDQPQKSPVKATFSRPASPLKSKVANAAERPASRAAGTTAKAATGTTRGKKTAAPPPAGRETRQRTSLASSQGDATDSTAGTTIVKKKAPATKKTTAKAATATTKAAAAKTAPARKGKENEPAKPRSLRTRAKA